MTESSTSRTAQKTTEAVGSMRPVSMRASASEFVFVRGTSIVSASHTPSPSSLYRVHFVGALPEKDRFHRSGAPWFVSSKPNGASVSGFTEADVPPRGVSLNTGSGRPRSVTVTRLETARSRWCPATCHFATTVTRL